MKKRTYSGQAGIILIEVLGVLTLFGIVGISFVTYSTPEVQCDRNSTVEIVDRRCTKVLGNTDKRP